MYESAPTIPKAPVMSSDLLRLLKSHDFLRSAIEQHGHRLSRGEAADLETRMDQIFTQIVQFSADDARITMAQARFLMSTLVELCADPARVDDLRKICKAQFDRLDGQVTNLISERRTTVAGYRFLHTFRDRVAVLDRQYRYVFTNQANAIFHNEDPEDFIGRANWLVTDEAFFETITRPIVDVCLEGRSVSVKSLYRNRYPQRAFAVEFMPVEAEGGVIDSVMGVCREVPVADVVNCKHTILVP